ncbi:Protein CBG06529 [Caenorhabditis briggsae]|uniref:Protein CBG06529 n=1 Tax=Caenorhabditis briggsae TaxID=6238 RepID=A8X2G1_CAEBR|nr:Protein CBG06529 [Caenorhabditis briggsae]CAP26821.1 Protein CBG06529 [Caenorhabditis briggsae]
MLNETCNFEESTGFQIIHILSSSISIPVYVFAFFILLFKSPEHFQSYRNYLVAHILSGFLLDIHMNYIWRVNIVLPIPIMCSNSFTAEYAPIVFQLLPFCIIFTGISVVSLFVYRMEAVILHRIEITEMRKSVYYSRNSLYVTVIFLALFSILMYPALKYQKDYKMKMEMVEVRQIPAFFISAFFKLNFLSDLVHSNRTCDFGPYCMHFDPLLGVLVAISVMVRLSQFPYLPYILVMIIQEHGAASTVTMFLTNNLLRKTMKKMMPFKFEHNTTMVHTVLNSGADSRYF